MIAQYGKRALSLFLALVMLFSAVPMQVFAEETHDHEGEGIVVASEDPTEEPVETPTEPVVTEPVVTEPVVTEPVVTEPVVTEPVVTEPVVTEPVVTEPVVTEPVVTEPVVTEPVVTEPVVTEPVVTEPAVTEPVATEPEVTEPAVEAPSELATELARMINEVLAPFNLTSGMSDEEIKAAIKAQPWAVQKTALNQISQIEAMVEEITDADAEYVVANADVETFFRFRDVMKTVNPVMRAASGTHTPVTGVAVGVSGASDNSMSNSQITVTATGSKGILGFGASSKTAEITITNKSGSKAKISFNWTSTSANSLDIDGAKYSGSTSGSFEKVMDNGESVKITLTTAKNNTTNKLVMKNFACAAVKDSSKVTFQYDDTLGSITVAGNAVDAGSQLDVPSAGAALVATPASGASFLAWIDAATHVILSRTASFTLEPSDDMTAQAIFTKTTPWFLVNGNALYGDLNAAMTAAASVSNKTVVLANDGTLPAGDYTIPNGVTLLIPRDAANKVYTTQPELADEIAINSNKLTAFRTLTMASGAKITVDGGGAISIAGMQCTGTPYPGSVYGAAGFVQMDSDSQITVKSGANLYAWGIVKGSGSVLVKNGGTVYEDFQVTGFRGGSNTTDIVSAAKTYRTFPFNQYYIQNIEVPLTLEAGAVENGYMAVKISLVGIQGSAVPFIGPNGMFNVSKGYIVKDYDESTDRLVISVYGNIQMKSLSITMKLGLLGNTTINSENFDLPVNNNITVHAYSGSIIDVTQDISLLPGAELIVDNGATCNLGSGRRVIAYDAEEWVGKGYADDDASNNIGADVKPVYYAPGRAENFKRTVDQDASVIIGGTMNMSEGYVHVTKGGADVTGANGATLYIKYKQPPKNAYQFVQKKGTYEEITLHAVPLKNADGTIVMADLPNGKYTYSDGKWTAECLHVPKETVIEATCTTEGKKTISCECGYSTSEDIPARGHTAGAAATCTTAQTCTVCGAELVAKLGHTEDTLAAVAPTCTATGLTEGKKCTVCGETTVAQTAVAALGHTAGAEATCTTAQTCTVCGAELKTALGHDEGPHEAKDPTCTEIGWDAYVTCSRCDYTTYVEKAALDHARVNHEAKDPTCTEIGWEAYETCSRCDYTTYVEKAALDHDRVNHEAKKPTCTEVGWDAYVTCSRCDYTTYEEIGALGHTDVIDKAVAPTCTETGLTEGKHCSVCGEVLVAQDEVAALGHTWGWVTDKEATVLESGIKHEECSVCHEKQNENTEIPVLACAHTGTMTITAAKDATCTEEGNSRYSYCSACQNYYSDDAGQHEIEKDSWIIAIKPHNHVGVVTAPTCTEAGYTTYTCSTCGDTYTGAEVAAKGHNHVGVVTEPTCTEAGYTTYTCSVCGDTYTGAEVAAKGHNHVGVVTEPTCTEAGYTTYTCACGDTYTGDEVAALGHNHQATVTYPAGVVKGYTVYTCSGCVDSYRTEWLDAAAYKGKTIAAVGDSITAAYGVEKDENDYVKVLADKLGMDYIRLGVSGTTLATDGSRTCNIGQLTAEKLNGADVVTIAMGINDFAAAAEGYYELGNIDSTDTSTIYGAMKMWCERIEELKNTDSLRDTQFYFVTPVITSWNNSVTAQRDWDQSKTNIHGYTLRDLCNAIIEVAACYNIAVIDLNLLSGMYYVDAEDNNTAEFGGDGVHPGAGGHAMMADALAKALLQSDLRNDHQHSYGSWITTTWAYCGEGMQHQVCSACGHVSEGVVIPTVGHIEVQHEAKAPTCTEIGWDAYVTCSRCDYTTYVELPVDADNHDIVKHDAKVPTCQEGGWDAYETCSRCAYTTRGEDLPVNPDGHVWNEGESYGNHNCNSSSYTKYTCTLCAETLFEVDREQHFRVPIAEEIPATCTTDGMTSGWKCEKCNEFWIPQEVIPALGHDWNENYPCQNDTSACTRCDLHYDTKQEHQIVVIPAIPATCTATGLSEGSYCDICGETLVEQTELPLTDHDWIVADMEVPARCGVVGHKEGSTYCLVCEYDEDPIPALNHQWMHRDAKLATYTAVGYNDHDYCVLCNVTKTKEQYEGNPCEFCGENPEGYVEIPKKEVVRNKDLENFVDNIEILEMIAYDYAMKNPGADPLALVLNYMRTAVSNYTSGSWAIMAGPEDKDFLKYVQTEEDSKNGDPEAEGLLNVSGLKQLKSYENTHGEQNIYNNKKVAVMSGHFFGTMDMTYHNKGSQNHADVGGWVGDLTDLLSTTDEFGVPADLTFEEKVTYIRNNYLFNDNQAGAAGAFGSNDLYADLDGYYFMNELINGDYEHGDLANMMREYYQPGLTLKDRVTYLLNNRLDGLSTRKDLRTAVYNVYTSNKLIATLEGTRNFNAKGDELTELRKAVCYAFADEMCRIAGDYVEDLTNPRFTVFDSETKILAPGVSQQINYATNADGKQIVYYVATADVLREDVDLWVNYYDRDPGTPENPEWKNNSVPSSAQNAQDRYGDPKSPDYIENFNVIASTNAGGYDMSDVATPGGLMVMNGVEWHPQSGTAGFFAMLDDGSAYMGTYDEYESMMAAGKIKEAIGGFGEFAVKDGKVVGSAAYSDAPRTSVGITATGRVVLMCIDGRQAPFSSGASMQDVGYIMKEAGCVVAINLDGGGSTTFVARQPGSDELTVMNRPSDGYPRNVSTNLLIYSTAPSSTAFDHAVIESEYDYATIGTPVQMTAAGVSPSGNAVDVPEGATWAVSSEDRASITADGVFTGKMKGEVAVYLMLDGQIIGSKQMTIENPDQLYFEREKVDAIYGSRVQLPLRARFEGKHIAINPNDVTITLSAPAAGAMDGFTFCAAESTVKSLSITAAIGEDIKASINVMLYKQGENSFDFDNATGGDRTLAWHREVSNSNVEDGNIYNVIDPSKDMVTSYTFALDMTTIPVPERLEELTYMLPGGTIAGTNAWTYLLSLAQRISDLSWVKATIDFDDRFVVDYSQLEILNEYFEQKGQVEYDEATNTLTVTMNWIKQSQVIDEATANPLCLIKGIKLTPKAGAWEDVSKIEAVTSGTIGYEIYMRASGLYGFAQKPESQAVFGLYPYRNPADTSDAGGYFKDTYADITDSYTLVNVVKEGWVNEDGGFAYYVNGERLTGVQAVDGIYYDFGEKGVNVGQTKFTGLFFDEEANVYRYSYIGELADGWQSINDEWYYFKNFAAVSGENKVGGVKFRFEQNGRLVSGVWVPTLNGVRYYYGPSYYSSMWHEIDGEMYYFKSGNRLTGYHYIGTADNKANMRWQEFDEDGKFLGIMSGLYDVDGQKMYVIDGKPSYGLTKLGDDYYFFLMDGIAVTGSYYAWDTKCDLPIDRYEFGADGKMIQGIVEKNNGYYYYINGKAGREYGLMQIDGDYYFVLMDGMLVTNQSYYVWNTKCDLPIGRYNFGPDGKLASGIVEIADGYYYYEKGKVSSNYGLMQIDGDYYFVLMDGKLVTDRVYYAWNTKCDLPMANYEFGADGKMLQGIVEKADGYYYYTNGKAGRTYGLMQIDDDYYFVLMDGKLITDSVYYAWNTKCDLPLGNYEFGADGKMVQGIVEKSDGYYYYTNGKAGRTYGLMKIGEDYYFVLMDGKIVTNQTYYAWDTKCDLPLGRYEFGEDGKMVQGIVEKTDGYYYYTNGTAGGVYGLMMIGSDYYFVLRDGKLVTNQTYYAWATNCDLTIGTYEFDTEGKMVRGIVKKDDGYYYYANGKAGSVCGLVKIDDNYYFVLATGQLVTGCSYYAWATKCDLPIGRYEFGEDGKMLNGFIEKDDGTYYYHNGKAGSQYGLIYVDGYYYFVLMDGKLIKNQTYHVWEGNGLLVEQKYTFDELGRLVY